MRMRSGYCGVRGDKVRDHTKQAGIKTVIKQSVPAFSAPVYHNRFPACFLILLYPFSLVQPAFQLTVAERQNHLDILLFFQNKSQAGDDAAQDGNYNCFHIFHRIRTSILVHYNQYKDNIQLLESEKREIHRKNELLSVDFPYRRVFT